MVKWVGGWVEIKKKAFSFHQISLLHKIFPCKADKTLGGVEGEKRRKRTRRGGNGGSEKLRIRRSTTW